MRFWRRGVPGDAAADSDPATQEASETAAIAPVEALAEPPPAIVEPRGWLGRLRAGLSRSSTRLS